VADKFRYAAFAVLGVLVLVILVQADSVISSGEAVGRSMRYDMALTGVNSRLDATNARERIARYVVTKNPEDRDAAFLFYDILVGRLEMMEKGAFGAFVKESPRREEVLAEAMRSLVAVENTLERLPDPVAYAQVNRALETASTAIDRLGGEAMSANLSEAARFRAELSERQRLQNLLLQLLIGFGAGLLLMMTLQAWFLRRARTEAERSARRFEFVARHDPLTRLPNRSAFHTMLQAEIHRLQAQGLDAGEDVAVLALDLDGFKAVNDILGHAAGDDLLVAVASRLSWVVSQWGEGNVASRLGGDEFTVLLRVKGGEAEALERAQEVSRALHEAHSVSGGNVIVNATIGLALAGSRGRRGVDILQNADLALSHAKSTRKGQVQVYDDSMRIDATRRRRIEADFEEGLAQSQIFPHFQPQVDMRTGRIIGLEALARWNHPTLGWISPAEFIPIAESSGRIVEIGERILEAACNEIQRMPESCKVSVNLSVAQLARDDLAETVSDVLMRTGLPAERLTLEVTESVVMRDTHRARSMLARLKKMGIGIALDDFGTGYSALSYLRDFDWDELKIDRSFVNSITTDEQSLSIIASIVDLADRLSISVTVEGVETRAQVDMLKGIGCNVAQGFLYGAAAPIDELLARSGTFPAFFRKANG
jgi:diguanylate cyclase (GGDEF)-like protein